MTTLNYKDLGPAQRIESGSGTAKFNYKDLGPAQRIELVILQYGRPISDIASNGWTPSSGVDLYAMLDEVSPDDGDYIASPGNPSTEQFEVKLSAMSDPTSGADHKVRVRFEARGLDTTYDMDLVEGSTILDSWTETVTVAEGPTTRTRSLTSTVANSITDYSDLRVRGVARAP